MVFPTSPRTSCRGPSPPVTRRRPPTGGSARRPARRRRAVAGLAGLALLTGYVGISHGSAYGPDIPAATVRALEAINRTDGVPDVAQNLVPGALAARDAAAAAYREAGAA